MPFGRRRGSNVRPCASKNRSRVISPGGSVRSYRRRNSTTGTRIMVATSTNEARVAFHAAASFETDRVPSPNVTDGNQKGGGNENPARLRRTEWGYYIIHTWKCSCSQTSKRAGDF